MSLRHITRTCLRTVQVLREQSSRGRSTVAGIKPSLAKPISNSGKFRWFSGANETVKEGAVDERCRIREAEKAEYVMQLIFFGPD